MGKYKVPSALEASAHSSADTNTTFESITNENSLIMKKMQQCSLIYTST
jgi:hypothetical protein